MRAVQEAYKAKGFKDKIDFFALHGHIMTLKQPEDYNEEWKKWTLELPIIPKRFEYKPVDNKTLSELKKVLKENKYDYLINCCDPDREGQHIFYSIYDTLGLKYPVKRMWHNDLSQNELIRALNEMPDDINSANLVSLKNASKLRAQMDWLIGINSTRAVSIKRNSLTRIGRVMTPTLKILADRENEIRNFKKTTSYGVEAVYKEGFSGELFEGKEAKRFDNEADAYAFMNALNKSGVIAKLSRKQTSYASPRLPSLGDVQADANKFFGYTLDKTLELVQSLYEKKLVSYPRTDCSYVTREIGQDFYFILENIGKEFPVERIDAIRSNKNYVNDSKVTAHYAIIPTKNKAGELSKDEHNIYELICRRFTSIFMPDNIVDRLKVATKVGDKYFVSDFSNTVQMGWKSLFQKPENTVNIPELKEGQKLTITEFKVVPHETKCPNRYNDASLLQAMIHAGNFVENKEMADILNSSKDDSAGIGTPATRAAIVEKLLEPIKTKTGEFYFVTREKKQFYVTDEGLELMKTLSKYKVSSPELTAYWEEKLQEIEKGQKTVRDIGKELIDFTNNLIKELVDADWGAVKSASPETDIECPLCHKKIKESQKFFMCSGYKNTCDFIISKDFMGLKVNQDVLKSILDGTMKKPVKLKSNGKSFEAKLKYDRVGKKIVFDNETKYKCPVCGKPLQSRMGKNGKILVCDDFIASYNVAGTKLTESQMQRLLEKGESEYMTFTSKAGKSFDAKLVVKDGKVEFEFKPKEK